MVGESEVSRAKELSKAAILAKPNVVGVGVGYSIRRGQTTDEMCVIALVRQKIPRAGLPQEALVPRRVHGASTDVIQVGDLRALQARTDRWRPAPGGVSLGHFQITAGTFGGVVRDRMTDDRFMLSNNHVLANSNAAAVGDPILQPGSLDGGQAREDTIATLERFIPIEFSVALPTCPLAVGVADAANALARAVRSRHRLQALQDEPGASNWVDAAVARPVNPGDISDEILEIGEVHATTPAVLAMEVRKSGRTTGFTTGTVTVLEATVDVSYGVGQTARFEGQIVTGAMSEGGDSGSLLVTGEPAQVVGLLFAGSSEATIYNPIDVVLEELGVRF